MAYDLIARTRKEADIAAAEPGTPARLRQLDEEVDQEHALHFGAAALGFIGAVLSVTVNGAFALLPAMAFATLGQFAVQGWSPLFAVLQRLGLRSGSEIDRERYALAATIEEPPMPGLTDGTG